MVTKIAVYCHGYGSSANTDKVERIAKYPFDRVLAWDIDIDPEVSLADIRTKVSNALMDHMHEPGVELVFIGTSLGAWYAAELAVAFGTNAVLINPAVDPYVSLAKYDVPEDIRAKYTPINITESMIVVLAKDDEVFDHPYLLEHGAYDEAGLTVLYETGGHRFNGIQFDQVMESIFHEPTASTETIDESA